MINKSEYKPIFCDSLLERTTTEKCNNCNYRGLVPYLVTIEKNELDCSNKCINHKNICKSYSYYEDKVCNLYDRLPDTILPEQDGTKLEYKYEPTKNTFFPLNTNLIGKWSDLKINSSINMKISFCIKILREHNSPRNIFHISNGNVDSSRAPAMWIDNTNVLSVCCSTLSNPGNWFPVKIPYNMETGVVIIWKNQTVDVYLNNKLEKSFTFQEKLIPANPDANVYISGPWWTSDGFVVKNLSFSNDISNSNPNPCMSLISNNCSSNVKNKCSSGYIKKYKDNYNNLSENKKDEIKLKCATQFLNKKFVKNKNINLKDCLKVNNNNNNANTEFYIDPKCLFEEYIINKHDAEINNVDLYKSDNITPKTDKIIDIYNHNYNRYMNTKKATETQNYTDKIRNINQSVSDDHNYKKIYNNSINNMFNPIIDSHDRIDERLGIVEKFNAEQMHNANRSFLIIILFSIFIFFIISFYTIKKK